ncbi:hypothetical protein [Bartonella machadoae]|uniref:hypothetical protein n=1 Tax=Bartonella machadoae TaxID=2893471 RepID=UPI001F4C58AC|nr:hypothetical protein [Bartonella machadoae]UNE54186.1 hypothetical protein LNM86_11780 [Bartonella machadoae]UNE55101.1 hypothetical protein LNM86_04525 [Bartonella machadoae]UNE55408.1 hypothetical protein LNM86_06305 [Bartonella machadoae]
MFSPLSKLSFGMVFLASVLLVEFGFMKAQVFKAVKARDLYWQLEIAKISARAQLEKERQRQAADVAESRAQRMIAALEQKLTKMEAANGTLPVTGCGIELERVRLLNKQAGG